MSPKRRKHHHPASHDRREIPIEDGAERTSESPASEAPDAPAPSAPPASSEDAARTSGPAAAEPEAAPAQASAEDRIRDLEDRLKRVQAEFLNETKRIARQSEERSKYAVEALVNDLLPVFDALHSARDGFAGRARASEAAHDEGAAASDHAALEGFELVEKELLNVLGRHGVTRIEAVGAPFDPALHHAIVMVERPDCEPGAVAMELRPGFSLHGRVVRPAHVAVAAATEKES